VQSDGQRIALSELRGQPLYAVAAIARPDAFFDMLRAAGLTLASVQALPDHYDFDSFNPFIDERKRVICTEKDAVKLWSKDPSVLAVPLLVDIDARFFQALDAALDKRLQSGAALH
jgi:tetraacyldisaccharide 4'-kinase